MNESWINVSFKMNEAMKGRDTHGEQEMTQSIIVNSPAAVA